MTGWNLFCLPLPFLFLWDRSQLGRRWLWRGRDAWSSGSWRSQTQVLMQDERTSIYAPLFSFIHLAKFLRTFMMPMAEVCPCRETEIHTHCSQLAGMRYLAKGFPKGRFQTVSSQTSLVKKLPRNSFWSYTLDSWVGWLVLHGAGMCKYKWFFFFLNADGFSL